MLLGVTTYRQSSRAGLLAALAMGAWVAAGHGPVHQSLNRRHYRA